MTDVRIETATPKVTAPEPGPVEAPDGPDAPPSAPDDADEDRFDRVQGGAATAPSLAPPPVREARPYTVTDDGAIVIKRTKGPVAKEVAAPDGSVSTLVDETIGDGSTSCLEVAYASGDDVTLFRDEDGVGHAIAASSAQAWLAEQEPGKYTEVATVSHEELERIFERPAGSEERRRAADALGERIGVPELATLRFADSGDGGSLDYGRIDRIAPTEYDNFLANPSKEAFDALVAKVAAHAYLDLRTDLAGADALLSVPGFLDDFTRNTGLEGYAIQDYLKNCDNLEYAMRELDGGLWSTIGPQYREVLERQNPGVDLSRLDIANMSPEQILSLSPEDRSRVTAALRGIGEDTAGNTLADLVDYFDRAGVDGGSYAGAKTAASARFAELSQEHPELIALLGPKSSFAQLLPHYDEFQLTYDPSGAGFDVQMDPSVAASYGARLSGTLSTDGSAPYLSALKQSIADLDGALTKIGKVPSFENLGVIAAQIPRLIQLDTNFVAGTPEGAPYPAALAAAQGYLEDAARKQKLKDIGMDALGGAGAALGLVAAVGGVFTGGAAWVAYVAGAAAVSGIGLAGLQVSDLIDRTYAASLNVPGYSSVNGKTMPTAGDWAGAILTGALSAADLGALTALPRVYTAAVKSKVLAQVGEELAGLGVDGLSASKLQDRLQYFDDLGEIAKLRNTLVATDGPTASRIIGALGSMSDAQILKLNRVLEGASARGDFARVMSGLDSPSAERVLGQVLGLGTDDDSRAILDLASRMSAAQPSAARALFAGDGLDSLIRLRGLGSTPLVEAAITRADAATSIPALLSAAAKADAQGTHGSELFRVLGDHDPRMAFELAQRPDLGARLGTMAGAVERSQGRGLETLPGARITSSLARPDGSVDDVLVLGPVTVVRNSYGGTELLDTSSSQARTLVRETASERAAAGRSWDFTPLRGYLTPDDNYVYYEKRGISFNETRPEIESLNRWITSEHPYVAGVPIYGTDMISSDRFAEIEGALRRIAAVDPSVLADIPEVQIVPGIGYAQDANGVITGDVAGLYTPSSHAIALDRDIGGADTMIHEVFHHVWRLENLDHADVNPFLDHGSGYFTDFGATSPEENFCEGAVVMMRDIDQILSDWAGYLKSNPQIPDEKLRWLVKLFFHQDPAAINVPPEITPGGPS